MNNFYEKKSSFLFIFCPIQFHLTNTGFQNFYNINQVNLEFLISTKFSHSHLTKNPHSPIFFFGSLNLELVSNANSNDINVSVNKKAKKGYFVFNIIFCQATHLQMHLQFCYLSLSLKKPKRKWAGSMCYDL